MAQASQSGFMPSRFFEFMKHSEERMLTAKVGYRPDLEPVIRNCWI